MPWKERVDLFCEGFYDAWNEGIKCGLDVFFAWEETFDGDDYLVYGLSPEWLKEHPESQSWTHLEQYEAVHKAGGCVVQAHPFRCRDYISMITLNKDFVDAVEVANAGNRQIEDAAAKRYAREFGLFETCGSDNHLSAEGKLEEGLIYGTEVNRKIKDPADYAQMILRREPLKLCVPEERFTLTKDDDIPLKSYWIDRNDNRTLTRRSWI